MASAKAPFCITQAKHIITRKQKEKEKKKKQHILSTMPVTNPIHVIISFLSHLSLLMEP
jgi:hypothetical protein